MGSGSTVAAAEAQGVPCIGVERFADYFELGKQVVPKLARLTFGSETTQLNLFDLLDA
jgi:site-specific DNA-methyltransferase (adenine-specific)